MSLTGQLHVEQGSFTLNVDLALPQGSVVALVGPNGAGKSTLVRVLAGLLPLCDGRLTLNGRVLDDPGSRIFVPPEQRPVGVAFQDYLLFPHLSALDNVGFGLRCRGLSRREARGQAQQWLTRLGLEHLTAARPRQLSGGQAQRVALARALAINPDLLLLDEPLSALDVGTRAEIRHHLRSVLGGFAGVSLIVTHDPIEAMTLAEKLIILEQGRVVQIGSPDEVTAQPRSGYVATFVGTNLLRGSSRGNQVTIDGGAALTVSDHYHGEVFVVVHPRAVAVHRDSPEGSARNVWVGQVSSLDPRGSVVRVSISGKPPIVAEVTPAAVAELGLVPSAEVWVSLKATEITTYPA